MEKSAWEDLKEQILLGGEQFLEKLRKDVRGDAKEQGAARRLAAARPTVAEVIASVERVKKLR